MNTITIRNSWRINKGICVNPSDKLGRNDGVIARILTKFDPEDFTIYRLHRSSDEQNYVLAALQSQPLAVKKILQY